MAQESDHDHPEHNPDAFPDAWEMREPGLRWMAEVVSVGLAKSGPNRREEGQRRKALRLCGPYGDWPVDGH